MRKTIKAGLAIMALTLLVGCGNKAPVNGPTATPAPTITSDGPILPTATPTPLEKSTITPSPTPVSENGSGEWEYKIVPDGYYNAAAKWNENGDLVEASKIEAGQAIYYNDCDEYYNNFVRKGNIFNEAEISLSDLNKHSCDNSIRITNRLSKYSGFSGFALKLDKNNGFPEDIKSQNLDLVFDSWIYYMDDLNYGIVDTLKFAVFCNSLTDEAKKAAISTDTAIAGMIDPETNDKTMYDATKRCMQASVKAGFSCVAIIDVPIESWTRVTVPLSIKANTGDTDTMIVMLPINETTSSYVNFFTPYYIDDIVLSVKGEESAEATE